MSEATTTTTTEWKSAFSYDNVDHLYTDMFCYPNNMIFISDGTYYAVSSYLPFGYSFSRGTLTPSVDNTAHFYDSSSGTWKKAAIGRPAHFSDFHLVAQDMDSTSEYYFSTSDMRSGFFPAPTGTYFDGMYVDSVLSEVTSLLPVLVPIFVVYVGIRKGFSFLLSLFHWG